MRRFGAVVAGVILLCAGPVAASTMGADASLSTPPATVNTSAGPIPAVIPGDHIAIACSVLDSDKAANDVRVVMRLTPQSGEQTPGFEAVIPTDEQRMGSSVRFRVPDMASLVNRTVRLKVYVLGNEGARSCDAGLVKIV